MFRSKMKIYSKIHIFFLKKQDFIRIWVLYTNIGLVTLFGMMKWNLNSPNGKIYSVNLNFKEFRIKNIFFCFVFTFTFIFLKRLLQLVVSLLFHYSLKNSNWIRITNEILSVEFFSFYASKFIVRFFVKFSQFLRKIRKITSYWPTLSEIFRELIVSLYSK